MTMSATFVAWAHRLLGSWVNSHQNLLSVLTAKLYSYPVHHFWRNLQRGLCLQSWRGHDGSSATERIASRTLPQSSCQERSRNASVALQTSQNWSPQQLLASPQSESNHNITFTSLLSRADEKVRSVRGISCLDQQRRPAHPSQSGCNRVTQVHLENYH